MASAEQAARKAVEEKLKEPDIQKLIHDTAMHMLATGEFQKDIQEEVHAKLPAAVGGEIRKQIPDVVDAKLAGLGLTPRTISDQLAARYQQPLEKFAGRRVIIKAKPMVEPTNFAERLKDVLLRAHIDASRVATKPGTFDEGAIDNAVEWSNADLAEVITALITELTGVQPDKRKARTPAADLPPDVTILVGDKESVAKLPISARH